MNNNKSEFAILVLSCDIYSDLWDPFFECFNRCWKDCPYTIYLGSNTINYNKDGVKTIFSGEDKDWSSSAKKIIDQIKEKYIWILLEDIFISETIDDSYIREIFTFCKSEKAKHVHEGDLIKPYELHNNFGVYPKGMPYRVNVRGFWDKEYMSRLLLEGETPWNFEIMGSYRSSYDHGFYCTPKKITTFINVVEKGKWISKSVDWCYKNNINILLDSRESMNSKDHLFSIIKMYYFDLTLKVSYRVRLKIMNFFRKLFISY